MKKTLLIVALCVATLFVKAQNQHHFSMSIGYGYMLSDIENTTPFANYANESHQRRMHNGINYELDYDWGFHQNFSLGAVFSMYNAFDSYYPNSSANETRSDDIYIFYVGPSFLAHTDWIKEHWNLYARATVGYMNFRNAMRGTANLTFKRPTFGYGIEAGCEYLLSKYFSLVGQVSYMGGSVSKVKDGADNKYELGDSENISRLNISLGVKVKL
ncbi:MAG: outer membrane beta-barrel protein [Bacteroidales bacterium]|nr:outer membrane beta-barrel protein [Bacteroidales bacterium]